MTSRRKLRGRSNRWGDWVRSLLTIETETANNEKRFASLLPDNLCRPAAMTHDPPNAALTQPVVDLHRMLT